MITQVQSSKRTFIAVAAIIAAVSFALLCLAPQDAHAVTVKNSPLKSAYQYESASYYGIDVNQDGTADTVSIYTGYNYVNVLINGRVAYTLDDISQPITEVGSACFKVMRTSANRAFVYVDAHAATGTIGVGKEYVLTYKSGKLACVLNCKKLTQKTGASRHYVGGIKASGKYIRIYNSAMAGKFIDVVYNYKYNGKQLVRTSKIGRACNSYGKATTIKTSLLNARWAYKTGACAEKKFHLSKGQKVTVTHFYLNGGRAVAKVKTASGKYGWVKVTDGSLSGLTVL